MQTKSLSQIFVNSKSWVALAALTLCFVGVAVLPAVAGVDINQIPKDYEIWLNPPFFDLISGYGEDRGQTGWSFVFETTELLSHSEHCYPSGECRIHNAYSDGIFILSGPNGLEFKADIVSGWDSVLYNIDPPYFNVALELFGYGNWNDPTHQFNTFLLTSDYIQEFGFGQVSLGTPEPSSLVLLGSGIVGLAGMLRRKLRL